MSPEKAISIHARRRPRLRAEVHRLLRTWDVAFSSGETADSMNMWEQNLLDEFCGRVADWILWKVCKGLQIEAPWALFLCKGTSKKCKWALSLAFNTIIPRQLEHRTAHQKLKTSLCEWSSTRVCAQPAAFHSADSWLRAQLWHQSCRCVSSISAMTHHLCWGSLLPLSSSPQPPALREMVLKPLGWRIDNKSLWI